MDFIPDKDEGPTIDVPYFGEARSADGWMGQGTTRSYATLKSEVANAIAQLGGVVHGIQRGTYTIGGLERAGARINYSVEGPNNVMVYGRMDVAALPVQQPSKRSGWQETLRKRQDASLSMALYNVVQALRAQWVLKQLNPAYIPLMPWLMPKGKKTMSEMYIEAGVTKALMSPEDFVDGDFREVEE